MPVDASLCHRLLDEYAPAIARALALDPAHPKARRDIEKARRLKGKIESSK